MIYNYKKRYINKIMRKRQEEKKKIKENFVESGDADRMINQIHKAGEATIKVEDLPF